MIERIRRFTKTIRFRMTFIYSLILFLFSSGIILLINFALVLFLEAGAPPPRPQDELPLPIEVTNNVSEEDLKRYEKELTRMEDERIREQRRDELESVLNMSMAALLPMALLSFLIGYKISGHFLKPLDELNLKFQKLSVEKLGQKIEKDADDEIGALVDSFNEMSTRLDAAFRVQSEFVQDAAHELKTPLSIITVNLDTILEDKNASVKELRTSIKNALSGIDRVNALTKNLLSLTEPAYKENYEEFNLESTVQEQVEYFRNQNNLKNLSISYVSPKDEILVNGDAVLFGQVIFNLIENAIKYSNEDDIQIGVKVSTKDNMASISITDNGPGIPQEHQSRIFDRFYRIDKSRKYTNGSFGLGLSIVKKIVEEHGGKIKLDSKPGKTSIEIIIPIKLDSNLNHPTLS